MRRRFLSVLLGLPTLALSSSAQTAPKMKLLIKSAWGSADPTQASFAFHHATAFAEAGHDVQIFLLGEAVSIMRTVVANSVVPVGWPPLSQALANVVEKKIPIHV
jgi:predicted peroxiredoxin